MINEAILAFYVDRVKNNKQTLESIKEPYRSEVALKLDIFAPTDTSSFDSGYGNTLY